MAEIHTLLNSAHYTLKQLQHVIGMLQWANTVVTPGRPFLRHLIDATKGLQCPFARITITKWMRADLQMWLKFLATYNGKTFFIMSKQIHSPDFHLYMDASFKVGASFMGSSWFVIEYPTDWSTFGITFLELFPIVAALFIFGKKLANHSILLHSDNQAATSIINRHLVVSA